MYMFVCRGQLINPFDALQMIQLFSYPSPFQRARLAFWDQWETLFPFEGPYHPCFYWQEPPTLELPQYASSLHSFCNICGADSELFAGVCYPCCH